MELHPIEAAFAVLEPRGRGVGRGRGDREPGRGGGDRVEVAHPHLLLVGYPATEQRAVVAHGQLRAPVLTAVGAIDAATELLRDELRAVTDAQDRHAEFVHRGIDRWCALDMHRFRAAREDDARRLLRFDLGDRDRVRHDLAVDVSLAHPPRDELCVLRAEVDDQHRVEPLGHGANLCIIGFSDPCRRPASVAATSPRSARPGQP